MRLYTIGFTRKSAEAFFTSIRRAGVKRIVDVRLNNVSQLAGFSKRDDLAYFARALCDADYLHLPLLAPTQAMLDRYRKEGGDWDRYARDFVGLMEDRRIDREVRRETLADACLLCSEADPGRCHRSLVAAYLLSKWKDVEIVHLA
jgi:uncharacterized protein (DUF488 family)